jgi:uncharacterized iron-regulated membrane protein
MKRFRTVLFWGHLTAGLLAGVVILVMSFTGAVLALKPQILDFIDRDVRIVTPQDTGRLGAHDLLMRIKSARPDASPSSLSVERDPAAAATVNIGGGPGGNLYVNPYTGAILGTSSVRANQFFQTMTTWHRYVGATGDSRPLGKSATGVSNLAFLVLALTGLYIWWPKQLTTRHLKAITWFRRTATPRARDFNWHNVIGFWCLPAIVVMTVSGVVISYPWASNLVFRLTGSPVPAARGGGPGPRPTGDAGAAREVRGAGEGRERRGSDGQNRGPEGANRGQRNAGAAMPSEAFNGIWTRAEAQVPTWSVLTARLGSSPDAPVTFTITDGAHWNAFARSTLTLNGTTGEVVQWQPYEASSRGQKVRGWLRFAHTGELGGLPGQLVAGLGCLGGVMLVYTGFSLAVRRFWNWSLWSRFGATEPSRVVEPAAATIREALDGGQGSAPRVG